MAATIPRMIFTTAELFPDRVALCRKVDGQYRDVTCREMVAESLRFGQALIALGMEPGDRVAIMAPNGPRWVYADLGIMAAGGVTVPVYQTETVWNLMDILTDSGSRFLFLHSPFSGRGLIRKLAQLPALEKIILFHGRRHDPHFIRLDDFLGGGAEYHSKVLEQRLASGTGADMATLVYTAGTTGQHKGVILSHENILASVTDAIQVFDIGEDDICLSFLPLSHIFERVDGYYLMLHQGAAIAYAESIESVPANLAEVRPTVVISVPRLFEKMFERIIKQVRASSKLKQQIFFGALEIGRAFTQAVMEGKPPSIFIRAAIAVARPIAFAKMRKQLGGRLRYFISGGAPLRQDVAELFFAADIPIYEGYGLTESSSGIAANTPECFRLGTVGKAFPGTRLRIADDGEILLSGPAIASGYWNRPEQSAEDFRDGWFKTGDIGELDQSGFLKITDRKKDMIITAAGKNIAPQILENRFKGDRYLSNAIVFGDRKPYLTALLVPDFETLEKYAHLHQIDFHNHCELVNQPCILELIRRHVDRLQKDLPSFNQVKRFTLLSRDFNGEHGEMTPTLKLKRQIVACNFESILTNMYLDRNLGIHGRGFCMVDNEEGIS